MNKIVLVGNVVKDAEVSTVGANGSIKCSFTLACNERLGKGKEKCNYINCAIWGKMAESVADYITKGIKVAVQGRLDVESREHPEYEGIYQTFVTVNVNELDFCGGSKKEESEKPTKKQPPKKKEMPKKKEKDYTPVDDGDQPF